MPTRKYPNQLTPNDLTAVISALRSANSVAVKVKCSYHPNTVISGFATDVIQANKKLAEALTGEEKVFDAKGAGVMTKGPTHGGC